MNLIPEWRSCWRLSSFQMAALIAAVNAAAMAWSAFSGHIDPIWWAGINMALSMAAGIARLVPQPKVTERAEQR